MNEERLARLEALLRAPLPEDTTFNMDFWTHRKAGECGTAACAAGLAMLDPWFQAQGLWGGGGNWVRPHFEGRTEYDALTAFFGIRLHEAMHIFCGNEYPRQEADPLNEPRWLPSLATPEMVADRIRTLLDTHREP
jgi:hypothetical protein